MRHRTPQRALRGGARRRPCTSRVHFAAPRRRAKLVRSHPRPVPRSVAPHEPRVTPEPSRGSRGSSECPAADARHEYPSFEGGVTLALGATPGSFMLRVSPGWRSSPPPRESPDGEWVAGALALRRLDVCPGRGQGTLVIHTRGRGARPAAWLCIRRELAATLPRPCTGGGWSSMGEAVASEVPVIHMEEAA
jgi:hypothetical protein